MEELDAYLLSEQIYWPLSARGGGTMPKFTLGALLLAVKRGMGERPGGRFEYERSNRLLDTIRRKQKTAWEAKAAAEFRARLTLWTNFMNEYNRDREEHAGRYGYEVGRRVMLGLLQAETTQIPAAFVESLSGLDALLRGVFVPGAFIWEPEMRDVFPEGVYWYLYGSLREE